MAKTATAYTDNQGKMHMNAQDAVLADISAAIGRVGDEGGLTAGVAKTILAKRKEIEAAFHDLDQLTPPVIDDEKERAAARIDENRLVIATELPQELSRLRPA